MSEEESQKVRKTESPVNSVNNRESGDLKPDDNPQIELHKPPTEKQEPQPTTYNRQLKKWKYTTTPK